MGKANFSYEFKRDTVAQITERGYPVRELHLRCAWGHDALKLTTHVRIVDITKVSARANFRAASLGHVACADRRVIVP
jgi:hypothetical protein